MKNIKGHKINIPAEIVESCWTVYKKRYEKIEKSLLPKMLSVKRDREVPIDAIGAFYIDKNRAESLKKTPLYRLFFEDSEINFVMKQNKIYLLRGLAYYIGILNYSNQKKLRIIRNNIKQYFNVFKQVGRDEDHILFLGLLDNLKNYLFIIYYAFNQISREIGYVSENVFDRKDFLRFLSLIDLIEQSLLKTFIDKKVFLLEAISQYEDGVLKMLDYINTNLKTVEKNKNIKSEIIRKMREADNFYHLLNFAKKLSSKYIATDTVIIGIEYGGIELPFILNAYRNYLNKSTLKFFTLNLSNYSEKSIRNIDNLKDAITPYYKAETNIQDRSILILDDSVMTGRSINVLTDIVSPITNNIHLAVVSFKASNRFHHLTRENHGGINPFVAENSEIIYLADYSTTYTKSKYTNKYGVFDKAKNRLQSILKKNYASKYGLNI